MKNLEKRVSELENNVKEINERLGLDKKDNKFKSKLEDNLVFFKDIGKDILSSSSKNYTEFVNLINEKKKMSLNDVITELKISRENAMLLANKIQDDGIMDIKYSAPDKPNFIKRSLVKKSL